MAQERRIGIVGAAGRMGRMLVQTVAAAEGCVLAGATERQGADEIGRDAGELAGVGTLDIALSDDAAAMFASVDVVIDFTSPAATATHATLAGKAGCAFVAGTTGLEDEHRAALGAAAQAVPVVWAPNMAAGVNLLFALTERVARALDADFDIEIVEMHHRHKVDAPSGTALALGDAAAAGRGVALSEVRESGRDGITGARARGAIGFASLRGGDVVGDHTVIFAGPGERIELTHKAASREIFASGAVRAARWTAGRAPGLYGMNDVLGLAD